jgi:transposase-like protein
VCMSGKIDRVEVITSVQRRRRWSAEEKARLVQETYAPGTSMSLMARQHGIVERHVCNSIATQCGDRPGNWHKLSYYARAANA